MGVLTTQRILEIIVRWHLNLHKIQTIIILLTLPALFFWCSKWNLRLNDFLSRNVGHFAGSLFSPIICNRDLIRFHISSQYSCVVDIKGITRKFSLWRSLCPTVTISCRVREILASLWPLIIPCSFLMLALLFVLRTGV